MNAEYSNIVHDLIVNMSGPFMLCVVAFFACVVAKIVSNGVYQRNLADSAFNSQRLQFNHEINKMAEQRRLIEQQVNARVVNVKRIGEEMKGDE